MKKGKLIFNIIIIITIIALILVIGYVAYYYISNYIALKEAEKAVDEFEEEVMVVAIDDVNESQENIQTPVENKETNKTVKKYYRGYSVIGTIRIPKTKVKALIVDKVTPSSISAAVATLYGPRIKSNRKYCISST